MQPNARRYTPRTPTCPGGLNRHACKWWLTRRWLTPPWALT